MGKNNHKKNNDNSGFIKALNERSTNIVHLTHNDLDAVGSDAIHRLKHDKIFTVWASVGRFISIFKTIAECPGNGNMLSISDLGYQDGAIEAVKIAKENGWKIEWRDHHRWTDEEKKSIEENIEYLNINTEVCATGIVFRDLMPDDEWSKEIARVVCDYDLWHHKEPLSKVLGEVCTKRRNLDIVRDCLLSGSFTNREIDQIYKKIYEEKNTAIKKSLSHTKILEGKYKVAFAPLYGYPSETAHAIRDEMKTDIEVIVSDNGKFSIRSVPPISHLIAKKFGGGGHPPAAGGSFKFSFTDKMAFLILKKNRHYKKLFDVSEKIKAE
ncbi:phosphoesterase [Methanoplanus sp. FWC-SCC4]|uniref:Phosphoesterase n=1 Tax=Methanochimaera problematica TaxID=2609417 RepID=A0AA97FC40_9EURY|nr:phosphoesterase [Methanoplanus sp. FWC-SCC4]WOF15797.1 phosphoesterase [Methanoplanus sp. FWC-SCC4]